MSLLHISTTNNSSERICRRDYPRPTKTEAYAQGLTSDEISLGARMAADKLNTNDYH